MNENYLTASYAEREKVKALGARWDPDMRKWYVPAGRDLSAFAKWLPAAGLELATVAGSGRDTSSLVAPAITAFDFAAQATGTEPSIIKRGVALSALLAGVSQAVAVAFKAGVWTMVEVVDTRLRSGHVYIELSERAPDGAVLAKANAVIWANNASRILPEFERATGATVGPGIKLLVRARPVFKAQYGFSIEIDAIDSEYTLGDLEATKREIRARLQQEGIFDGNRKLPAPWDFNAVLVIAPVGAAGLGDFQAESERLERFRICSFVYATSRFQGEGAAAEIRAALLTALDSFKASAGATPDAIVIIRGGGAVNDLAWLNDYELVRCICELEVPVLTGIGHERDSTVLDEVANTRFDTPSKVISGIEQVIAARVAEAKAYFEQVARAAGKSTQTVRREVEQADATVKSGASRHLANARQASAELMAQLRIGSVRAVKDAAELAQALAVEVRFEANHQLALAKQAVPALMAEVTAEARQAVRTAKAESRGLLGAVTERAGADVRTARDDVDRSFADVGVYSRQAVSTASTQSQALMREIAGQGPEKTLARGFAVVRNADGETVTSARNVPEGTSLDIQFRDGQLAVATADTKGRKRT